MAIANVSKSGTTIAAGTSTSNAGAMAMGTLLFLPAASLNVFSFFLAALVIIAAGMTALQVSANPYVAVLGPQETASIAVRFAQEGAFQTRANRLTYGLRGETW